MKFVYSDDGRSKYYKGIVGDCVVRAICNATNSDIVKDYQENSKYNIIKGSEK